MDLKVSKGDVIWSYIAQFFNIGAGLITLPLILHMLSTEEIAMNYLMMTVGSLVALIDFGFAPQFGRNISYVFSGSQVLLKEGLSDEISDRINYHLLFCLIKVARKVYLYMSIIILILMLTLGSLYMYHVTDGFTKVENSLSIWVLYSLSTFFNIYFYYYSSLLIGKGLIKEEKKANLYSRIVYIIITYILLLLNLGLIGVAIANFIAPFISRWMSYHYFYDRELVGQLSNETANSQELNSLFIVIWHNAKKLGITFVGGYAVMKFSLFIAGLYLTLAEISSYGLMMQLVAIIATLSTTFFSSVLPRLSSLRVNGERELMIRESSFAVSVFYVAYFSLTILLLVSGNSILHLLGANALLPSFSILVVYSIVTFLENNHSLFGSIITTGNSVPYYKAGIVTGAFVCLGDYLVLEFSGMGLMGLVLVQGVCQLSYQNWYWPKWACKELDVSFLNFTKIGIAGLYNIIIKKGRMLLDSCA